MRNEDLSELEEPVVKTFADIIFAPHSVLVGGIQGKVEMPCGGFTSVVGGSVGAYGDGVTTFEVWFSDDDEPRGYLTREEVDLGLIERTLRWVQVKGGPKT